MTDIKQVPEIWNWVEIVENDTYRCCEDQHLLIDHIKKCFETEDIYVDTEQLKKYMKISANYVPFSLFPWQKFVIALHDCTYWSDTGMPRWPDLF